MRLSRRDFLKTAGGSIALAATSFSMPAIFARTARAAAAANGANDGRVLVIVQLTGGNDGLNTVIPYAQDLYKTFRPTVGVDKGQVLRLNDEVGFCPQLRPLKELFDDGLVSVVQGVGYPNPNRSHFQSMDIWHTADPTLQRMSSGWLGRVLDRDVDRQALHLDTDVLPVALRAERVVVPSVQSIDSFRLQHAEGSAERAAIERLLTLPRQGSDELLYVQRTTVEACENAKRLERISPSSGGAYPNNGLSQRLRQIAQLIAADFGPQIYYTSLGGFDTHARQNTIHPDLMTELAGGVAAFQRDLLEKGLADRVLLMTFSEFGRRARENGSYGTDHGAAAPLLVVGQNAKSGVIGPAPDLSKLVEDDIPHAIDFRSVYSALLGDWLGVAPQPILGGEFGPVSILRT